MNQIGTENVVVKSVPSSADVRVSNGAVGQTPFVFRAGRKGGCTVIVSKPGFRPLVVGVASSSSAPGLKPNPILVRLSPFASGQPSGLLAEDSLADEPVPVVKKVIRRVPVPVKIKPAEKRAAKMHVDANGTEYLY